MRQRKQGMNPSGQVVKQREGNTESRSRRNEQGFVMVEILFAMVLLSLALLTLSELWQASQQLERRTQIHLSLSRHALSTLEQLRAESTVAPASSTREISSTLLTSLALPKITESVDITQDTTSGLILISLRYQWQEGGRSYEQRYATLHR